jgi:uncharacterized membrane protein YhhN
LKTREFSYIPFALIIAGVFIAGAMQIKWLEYVSKPMIMIWIALFFALHRKSIPSEVYKSTLAAFAFSWLGDILLLFSSKGMHWFLAGLVSFLVSQLLYIQVFSKTIALSEKSSFIKSRLYMVLGFLAYGIIVYSFIGENQEPVMKVAIIAYMFAILTMSAMALNRKGTCNHSSFLLVFAGSLLFLISDTLIAINKFYTPIPFERISVMGTYVAAQFLIMKGLIRNYV